MMKNSKNTRAYVTRTTLFGSLFVITIISAIGISTSVDYITEEYLIEEYDKIFPNTDAVRGDKIAVMNNVLNTVPLAIPENLEREKMIEKISTMIEKRDANIHNLTKISEISNQINNMKGDMATLGLTLIEDHEARNQWYDLADGFASKHAYNIPGLEEKFKVIPEAEASNHWNVQHKLKHQCSAVMCSNTWNDYVTTGEYSYLSVVIDTVAWPNAINSWQVADNLSLSFRAADTQGWASLTSGDTIVLNTYKTTGWAFWPYESNQWSMLSDLGTLQEDDVYYSTVKINST